jgi:hypothetical protein
LLSPTQALLAALLATATLWLALTGLTWASYRQDELLITIWYVITGAAEWLFVAVWLVLAVRAAASIKQFRTALDLFVAAEACFLSALGCLLLLIIFLIDRPGDPSLVLFAVLLLVNVALIAVPPAIAVTAGGALWSGILAARESAEQGAGDRPAPPID